MKDSISRTSIYFFWANFHTMATQKIPMWNKQRVFLGKKKKQKSCHVLRKEKVRSLPIQTVSLDNLWELGACI